MGVFPGKIRGRHRILDDKTGEPRLDRNGEPVDNGGRKGRSRPVSLTQKMIDINEAERDA